MALRNHSKFLPLHSLYASCARHLQHLPTHGLNTPNVSWVPIPREGLRTLPTLRNMMPFGAIGVIPMRKVSRRLSYHKSTNFKMQNTSKVHSVPLSLWPTQRELLEAFLTRWWYRREATYSMTYSDSRQKSDILLSKSQSTKCPCWGRGMLFNSIIVLFSLCLPSIRNSNGGI